MDSLRRKSDIQNLFARGKKIVTPYFVLYVSDNDLGTLRTAVIAGKGIGKAVVRNRVRRILKEAIRLSIKEGHITLKGKDIIIVARKKAVNAKTTEILPVVKEALRST